MAAPEVKGSGKQKCRRVSLLGDAVNSLVLALINGSECRFLEFRYRLPGAPAVKIGRPRPTLMSVTGLFAVAFTRHQVAALGKQGTQIGQFALRSRIGTGARGAVYLAHDSAMDRYLALKLIRLGQADDPAVAVEFVQRLAKLQHPALGAVLDVGVQGELLYVASEFISGRTLGQLIRQHYALGPEKACRIICEVLGALEAAHGAGIFHGNLTPENVLVEGDGQSRLVDFWIPGVGGKSPRIDALPGLSAYSAPEYLHTPELTARYDLHAVGVLLFEMLVGASPYAAATRAEALKLLKVQEPVCPDAVSAELGPTLTALMMRSIDRDPDKRFVSAADMLRLLNLEVAKFAARRTQRRKGMSRLEELLDMVGQDSDFPALGPVISDLQKLTAEGDGGAEAKSLPSSILNDFALTSNLLRIANSAYYARGAKEPVTTVSKAVVVLGLDAVRDFSLSLLLLNQLKDKGRAELLQQEYLRLNRCALTAQELNQESNAELAEQAYLGGLFHNLGRLLCCYAFPEIYDDVETRLQAGEDAATAECSALGVSYEAFGRGAAQSWGLDDALVASIEHVSEPDQSAPQGQAGRLRLLSSCAAEVAVQLEHGDSESLGERLSGVARRFSASVGLSHDEIYSSAVRAEQRLGEMAGALGIAQKESDDSRMARLAPVGAAQLSRPKEPPPAPTQDLNASIEAAQRAIAAGEPLNRILSAATAAIHAVLGCDQVLLLLVDPSGHTAQGRFSAGVGAEAVQKKFLVPLNVTNDLFAAAMSQQVDLSIKDARVDKVQRRLPAWFKRDVSAVSFLFLPMRGLGSPVGAIFARWTSGELQVDDGTLQQMRDFRALLAKSISARR